MWQPVFTRESNPVEFLKGLCGGKRVLLVAPTVAQPRASPSKSLTGFFFGPTVLRTKARTNLGCAEEKRSRYAKARVQIPNNPAGWLNTQAWGLANASMGIRYIRGDAEDLPLPAFGVGGGFKVKNIKEG